MELETQIVNISEDALDNLFNETPDKTVNADTLIGGKKEATEDNKANPKESNPLQIQDNFSNLPDIDLDDMPNTEEEEEEKETKEEKKEEPKEEEKEQKEDKKAKKEKEEPKEASEDVVGVLKSTVDYLIEQGIWQDFDGRADLDINEETYAKLVAEQDKYRLQTMFGELVDSTGPYGKAIIEFVQTGGNPDEVIDLFKEQKQVESISIDEIDGQKEMIRQYYENVLGWKKEKIEKFINSRLVDNELEAEAKEAKDLFANFYKKEVEKLNKEREEFVQKQREAEEAFENNIKSTIKERKDLTPTERKTIEDYLLSYDQKLPNGQVVNKFYVNFAKMQADPKEYVDLVLFVMDKQKFLNKIQTQEGNKATEKAFQFIKGNGAVSKTRGTTHEEIKKAEKVTSFDWGLPKK